LARKIAGEMTPGKLYLVGPGRSAHLVLEECGLEGSFIGVDALADGEILSLLGGYEQRELILGVIGGQGFLLGRGNQQISTSVISALGFGAIQVMASAQKIGALIPATLHVDLEASGERALFPRYIQVHTAPNRTILCSIEVPASYHAMTVM
jgi:predicted polyphosphate/ATP-dependent NAD kinase